MAEILFMLGIYIWLFFNHSLGSLNGKESALYAGASGDEGSIPGLGRSPGGGHYNPLLYSCLENPMYRGTWQATVHGFTKSQTRLRG